MKKLLLFLALVAAAFLCVRPFRGTPLGQRSLSHPPTAARPLGPTPSAVYGRIPLQFVPNEGQAGGPVDFYVQGRDKTIFFSEEGLTFVLGGHDPERWAVKLDFVDPSQDAGPVGLEKSGAIVSYFKGKPEEWKVGLPAYSKIAYRELWPGIDLVYSGTFDRMKYEFVVRPGADPSRIRLAYRGAGRVELTGEGRLSVETPSGSFLDEVPVAHQEIGGKKVDVTVSYEPGQPSPGGPPPGELTFVYGFRIGEHDRSRTLILDPAVPTYCGFIGGSESDVARDIAFDSDGNAYVVGETSSVETSFPVAAGPAPIYGGGACDVFVAKLDPSGTALLYCGYIGGAGSDHASRLAVDDSGNAYIAGFTDSTEATFPVVNGPDLTYNGGASDAFVASVNAAGTALLYCGYIGGSGSDRATSVAVGLSENAFVTGFTDSTESSFPVQLGPDLTYNGGASDAFVAALSATGISLVYCGYVGGAGQDEARSIVLEDITSSATGSGVWIAGSTASDESTFPVARFPDMAYNGGPSDAFAAYIHADIHHAATDICGYIGGAGSDEASGVVCQMNWWTGLRTVSIAGTTSSSEATFPVKVGPDLTYNGGASDAFVATMQIGTGEPYFDLGFIYCGYIGGAGTDAATDISLTRFDIGIFSGTLSVAVAGWTSSSEATFPALVHPGSTYNGGASDAFVAKVAPSGTGLVSCGYIGGAGADEAWGLACYDDLNLELDSDGPPVIHKVYLAGGTSSPETSFPVSAGPDLTYNGGDSDAFAAEIGTSRPVLTSLSPSWASVGEPQLTLVAAGRDLVDGAVVLWQDLVLPTTYVSGTELRADVGAGILLAGGAIEVRVRNPDEGFSDPLIFEVRNPLPILTSISPAHAQGGQTAWVTLTGSRFANDAQVIWGGGEALDTMYVSDTEIQALVDLGQSGDIEVRAWNPPPAGGLSQALICRVSGFAMTMSPANSTVTAGETATFAIEIAPQSGSFDAPIFFECKGLPQGWSKVFSRARVTPGSSAVTTTLRVNTRASSLAAAGAAGPSDAELPASAILSVLLLAAVGFSGLKPLRKSRAAPWLAAAALVLLMIMISACGVGGSKAHESFNVTVLGSSGSMTVAATVTLVVE